MGILFVLLLAVAVWFFVLRPHQGQNATPFGRHALMNSLMPVGVAVAEKGDMPITLEGLGTVTPLATGENPDQWATHPDRV